MKSNECQSCHELIKIGATKCKHCNSYQGKWKWLNTGFSTALVITTLVSTIFAIWPLILDKLNFADSEFLYRYIDRADVYIPVIVTNKGQRAGILASDAALKLTVVNKKGEIKMHIIAFTLDANRGDLIVEPAKSKQLLYYAEVNQPLAYTYELLGKEVESLNSIRKCSFLVSDYAFNGKRKSVDLLMFDASNKTLYPKDLMGNFDRILQASSCLSKIPSTLRQKYNILP